MEEQLTLLGMVETKYPQTPEEAILETFPNPQPGRHYHIRFNCQEFTSLCPITQQPDFAKITIDYIPGKVCLESKALKLYLFSFRNEGMFHEAVTNRILDDLVRALSPNHMKIEGNFSVRGGINIDVVAEYTSPYYEKLLVKKVQIDRQTKLFEFK